MPRYLVAATSDVAIGVRVAGAAVDRDIWGVAAVFAWRWFGGGVGVWRLGGDAAVGIRETGVDGSITWGDVGWCLGCAWVYTGGVEGDQGGADALVGR